MRPHHHALSGFRAETEGDAAAHTRVQARLALPDVRGELEPGAAREARVRARLATGAVRRSRRPAGLLVAGLVAALVGLVLLPGGAGAPSLGGPSEVGAVSVEPGPVPADPRAPTSQGALAPGDPLLVEAESATTARVAPPASAVASALRGAPASAVAARTTSPADPVAPPVPVTPGAPSSPAPESPAVLPTPLATGPLATGPLATGPLATGPLVTPPPVTVPPDSAPPASGPLASAPLASAPAGRPSPPDPTLTPPGSTPPREVPSSAAAQVAELLRAQSPRDAHPRPEVALRYVGAGTSTARRVRWDQGTLDVEVTPDQGIAFGVSTREAEIEVLGTGFRVVRDELGTHVSVRHGRVQVDCAGARAVLTAGQGRTCVPTTAAGLLGRARGLAARGAPAGEILVAVREGLAAPASTVEGELRWLEVETLRDLGDPAWRAHLETLAAAPPAGREVDLLRLLAETRRAEGGCAAALAPLRRLQALSDAPGDLLALAVCTTGAEARALATAVLAGSASPSERRRAEDVLRKNP